MLQRVVVRGIKTVEPLTYSEINTNSGKKEEVLSRVQNIRVTVRLSELGIGGMPLHNELLWSGGTVVLNSSRLVELIEIHVVGLDGEGLIKTLVRGESVWNGIDVRLKKRELWRKCIKEGDGTNEATL